MRSGGQKSLFTSLMEEIALEHGAAVNRWTEVKNYALANIKQQKVCKWLVTEWSCLATCVNLRQACDTTICFKITAIKSDCVDLILTN